MRRTWRLNTAASVSVLALAGTALCSSVPGASATDDPRPIVGSSAAQSQRTATVTLVSGDRVRVSRTADGQPFAQLLPGLDGTVPDHETLRDGDDLYVFTETASRAIASGLVDRELFNVTGLVELGLDDAHTDAIRLITQYAEGRSVSAATPTPTGTDDTTPLGSVNSLSYAVDKADAQAAWSQLTDASSAIGKGIDKIWLDRPLTATLADSTDQIGAPVAWQAGLDGKGSTVAVLDTGIDAEHPDLAGQIVASKDFTGSATGTGDVVGHGTHVASTVAGTGAASGGKERGVAPGADLLIGKVLGDNGGGYESQIIEGMQWAVAHEADVVSMSLGSSSPTTTCDDPIAQAVDELSASSRSLFVIAAGNIGASQNTVSSPGCASSALTVGAVDSTDATAQFSSRGPVGGTHVLKPEIAAPGVRILAAAAGGRGVYAYQSMSGTSMATPHVAGAAAIAREAHPGLTGAGLKDLLVSSADPTVAGPAQEVGAGRLDVTRMLAQQVTGPSVVKGGSYDYPQTKAAAARTLTYTNRGDTPVDLRLAVTKVTGNDVRPLNTPLLKLPQHVVVPARSSVDVPVTVQLGANIPDSSLGDITARIVATGANQRVSTAFNLYAATPSVDVEVTVIDRNGDVATGSSSVDLVNTDTSTGERRFTGGKVQTFRVRPGRYFLTSFATTPTPGAASPASPESVSYLARPEVTIDDDTSIVLDARRANPLTVATEQASELRATTLTFERQWPTSRVHAGSYSAGAGTREIYAQVVGKVAKGDGAFEFGHWSRRVTPIVSAMTTAGGLDLHPLAPRVGVGNLDGEGTAQAVPVGAGTAADFAAVNVAGKVAVAHVAGGSDFPIQTRAAAAGAKALLVYRDDPATWLPAAGFNPTPLPVYSLPSEEGAALGAELAAGAVTLTWSAHARSPYAYTLGFFSDGQLVTAQHHRVADSSLGRIKATYDSMGATTDFGDMTAARRPSGLAYNIGGIDGLGVPSSRTELLTADGTEWYKSVISSVPFGDVLNDRFRTFTPGQEVSDAWHGGVLAPGVRNDSTGAPQMVAERQGDFIGLAPTMWADSAGHWADQGGFGDLGRMELRRNGELIAKSIYAADVFRVPADESTYELTFFSEKVGGPAKFWKRSTALATSWTFASRKEDDVYSRALPLLFPRLGLPADGLKTVAAGTVTIPARVQPNPGYDAGALAGARVWTSTDGGATWVEGTSKLTTSGADLVVDHTADAGKPVSLRVELTDAKGTKVVQTITRAYDVR